MRRLFIVMGALALAACNGESVPPASFTGPPALPEEKRPTPSEASPRAAVAPSGVRSGVFTTRDLAERLRCRAVSWALSLDDFTAGAQRTAIDAAFDVVPAGHPCELQLLDGLDQALDDERHNILLTHEIRAVMAERWLLRGEKASALRQLGAARRGVRSGATARPLLVRLAARLEGRESALALTKDGLDELRSEVLIEEASHGDAMWARAELERFAASDAPMRVVVNTNACRVWVALAVRHAADGRSREENEAWTKAARLAATTYPEGPGVGCSVEIVRGAANAGASRRVAAALGTIAKGEAESHCVFLRSDLDAALLGVPLGAATRAAVSKPEVPSCAYTAALVALRRGDVDAARLLRGPASVPSGRGCIHGVDGNLAVLDVGLGAFDPIAPEALAKFLGQDFVRLVEVLEGMPPVFVDEGAFEARYPAHAAPWSSGKMEAKQFAWWASNSYAGRPPTLLKRAAQPASAP